MVNTVLKNADERRSIIQEAFNERLKSWFENAKIDYQVEGSGHAYFDKLPREIEPGYVVYDFHVYYEENGVKKHSLFSATDEELFETPVSWLFDIWSADEMPTTEEAKGEQEDA